MSSFASSHGFSIQNSSMTDIQSGQNNVNITVANSQNNRSATGNHHTEPLFHTSPPLPLGDAQVYARQLLLKRHGYTVAYRTKGVRIGDVGFVTPDGAFETLFNIRASAQDPINRRGVPENFERVDIGEYDINHLPEYHQPGSVVTSRSAQSVSFGVDFSTTQQPLVPVEVDTGSQFIWSTPEGAILHLPHDASRLNCPSDLFKSHAITHAYNWYKFANVNHHRGVPNGSLYLITGTDKTSSWVVDAFSGAPPGKQVSLHPTAVNGSTSYKYSWATTSAPVYRMGRRNMIDPITDDDINQDNTVFLGDAPENQNQCVFMRGYRIMLNYNATAAGGIQLDGEVLPVTDINAEEVSVTTNDIPFSATPKSSSGSCRSGGGFGSGQRRVGTSEDSGQYETLDNETLDNVCEVVLQSIPEFSEPDHPSTVINKYLLESVPKARVAVTHDYDWIALIRKDETAYPTDSELISRLCKTFVAVEEFGGVSLQRQPTGVSVNVGPCRPIITRPNGSGVVQHSSPVTTSVSDKIIDTGLSLPTPQRPPPTLLQTSVDPLAVAGLLNSARDCLQNVKIYRHRCRNLIQQCDLLINALWKDGTDVTPSATHADALYEARFILKGIRESVAVWANLSTLKSLRKQDEIREAVDEFHRRVDTCIAACNVRISRQLAHVQQEHSVASQRDIGEIREMVPDLMEAFIRYISIRNTLSSPGATFEEVIENIREEIYDIQSATSVHNPISEENSESQSFVSQSDAFDRAMKSFCKSLATLELAHPKDVISRAGSPHGSPYRQPPTRTSSRLTLTGPVSRWRSSTVSLNAPQIPPLDFGDEHTFWPPACEGSSLYSKRNSVISGISAFTRSSRRSRVERRQSDRSSVLDMFDASGPLSPLKVALTTRVRVWKSGGQPRVITKATMEGLLHYMLLKSVEEDKEQHDVFFIAHLALIAPLHLLGMLIRRYDEALMCPVEVCHDIQTRVMRLIRDWLNNENVILADDVLTEMRKFVHTVIDLDYLDELVLEVVQGIRKKGSIILRTASPLSPATGSRPTTGIRSTAGGWPTKENRPTPSQLALALTKLEGEQYLRIFPTEYTANVGGLPLYSPNLSAAITLNQLIENWVQSCILDEELGEWGDGLEKRAEVKQFFVETAKECRKTRNFSSLGAIIDALRSKAIARLTSTTKRMPFAARLKFQKLVNLLKPDSNYDAYRKALLKDERKGCIPWHVVNLHDINTIIEQQEDVDEQHEPPLLNVKKWANLKHQAMSTLRYNVPSAYEAQGLEMAMEYLTKNLQRVSPGEDLSRALEARSLTLKMQEDQLAVRLARPRSWLGTKKISLKR